MPVMGNELPDSFVDYSISRATMIAEDIVEAIESELEGWIYKDNSIWSCIAEFWDAEKDSEDRTIIFNEDIWDAMNAIAPEGTYFGSHPGDGSDYGFWTYDEDEC